MAVAALGVSAVQLSREESVGHAQCESKAITGKLKSEMHALGEGGGRSGCICSYLLKSN